ncbi:probable galacturonosyltransferase 7 isoform X2 [Macadamia integrifolia]|uniref:probable galacturonosyltransferase 7 isoform X2 n=1 Tax=Macadamia integrifolia TaxID=60698 RepID=UPI001C4F0898|nr:probable galacturonosyltransferase 7 isoform X2 [Macadamia integrifolia]
MKGGGGGSLPAKRAWRGLGVAVLGLVILSMLVPLVFLLGLHNGFHTTGYVTEDRSPASDFGRHDPLELSKTQNQSEPNRSAHLDDIMKRLGPAFSKVASHSFVDSFAIVYSFCKTLFSCKHGFRYLYRIGCIISVSAETNPDTWPIPDRILYRHRG